jgi:hypothetical protein
MERACRWTSGPGQRRLRSGRREATPRCPSLRLFRCSSATNRFRPESERATTLGRPLALPKANPRRIVVIGDTGCRIKTSDNVFQACGDSGQWPFAAVAAGAAAAAPDLVIHVGDYHYRENECPAGNTGCAGSPWGYGWDAWEADVFAPGEMLFAAAPWIVVRGNHESCTARARGGGACSIRAPWYLVETCDTAATTRSAITASRTPCR